MKEALLEKTQEYYDSDEYGKIVCDGSVAIQTESLIREKLDVLPQDIFERLEAAFYSVSDRAACAEEFIREKHMEDEYDRYLTMTGFR